ncbi:MAG TPA: hypothetical protein DCQ92_12685 [Verrucomicrobia subdivision 3 bacterium]|nr:hypothetical protein [Limisphaerales bacterium]
MDAIEEKKIYRPKQQFGFFRYAFISMVLLFFRYFSMVFIALHELATRTALGYFASSLRNDCNSFTRFASGLG